jgi:DNA polymerase-3 subunit alpha
LKLTYPGSIHNHTDYSNLRLRDSINTVETLIDRAIELGHTTVAITEHETVTSSLRAEKYYNQIKKDNPNFKVLRGNEIYLCRNGLNAQNYDRDIDRYFHFILIAKDAEGHKQIRELSTRAWMRAYSARGMMRVPTYYTDLEEVIGENRGHIIASTACLGGCLAVQLLRYRENGDDNLYTHIIAWLNYMVSIFGEGNFYLEMQPSFNEEQIYVNNQILKLSKEYNIPFIITNDAHYLKKEDAPIHEAFLNSQDGDREVKSFYETTYLMSNDEIYHFMKNNIGEENLQTAFRNIQEITDKCEDFTLVKSLKIPRLDWKEYPISLAQTKWVEEIPMFKKFLDSEYEEDRLLARALMYKLDIDESYRNKRTYDEINACLDDTWVSSEKNGARWSAYYLNLQNIIDLCWEAGSYVGPGRGSGVGFILLNMLDVTQINPLREKTQMFRWRFLNPERVSVLDVDLDIEGNKRSKVLQKFREYYGEDRVSGVLTLGTEKSKSAILTACRGTGVDNDVAAYLSSMIVADRGQLRSLKETFYGDEEKGIAPNKQFQIEMTQNYPEVWKVAQYIEGLICRTGVHAGGVIFVDEPFTESAALMRSPKGEIITQFDLHSAEELGLIKYDVLSIEGLDNIHNCIDLLARDGLIETESTVRKTYEKIVGVYNLERDSDKMWNMVCDHKIMSLFQMEQASGIRGIELTKPRSVDELAVLNSVIRLMAPEKGAEQPLEMWARYRKNIGYWIQEMRRYGLSEEEIEWLSHHSAITDGICESQEGLMSLVQEERLGGNSLTFADKCRKGLAKKIGSLFDECEKEFYKNIEEKGCSQKLAHYVWDVLLKVQRGYSFNRSHCFAYSIVALQEMNLAYKYPIVYWNCACLITNSGGQIDNDDEFDIPTYNCQDENEEEKEPEKKKNNSVNYGKVATAIGQMQSNGITISPPDINKSSYTFIPDAENNQILYGMKGITKIGDELVDSIIKNRPYSSLEDLVNKVKLNKTQVVMLIKSGALDCFGDREQIMEDYLESISDKKKTLNLRNLQMLITMNLLPPELEWQRKVFFFNKHIRTMKVDSFFELDEYSFNFYEKHYNIDNIVFQDNRTFILQSIWKKIYDKEMDVVRTYIKNNLVELLDKVNFKLYKEVYDKYALGSLSKWEMDSISFYHHPHELANLQEEYYDVVNFFNLPEQPIVDRVIPMKGKQVPLFKLQRIAGTVLDRDKDKNLVTILTNYGVVKVKVYRAQFTKYDKQISERGDDGKKHVKEASWFSRGNKLMIVGIRRDDCFVPKLYKNSPYETPFFLIENIDSDGYITGRERRMED